MNNYHTDFLDYDSKIVLTKARKGKIIISRDAVKEKIKGYFSQILEIKQPKFYMQGSFVINTAINPIDNNEVDLDYGVYLQHLPENMEDWIRPKEAHQLIIDSLKNHTQDGCVSKTSCVRVVYKNFYHLDLPVYVMFNGIAYLAQTKTNKWINSDSKSFKDWFYKQRNGQEQVNRLIRYIKSWRDINQKNITSIAISILVINNYSPNERDDISLLSTLGNINNYLKIYSYIKKPVSPYEDLWQDLSETEKSKNINDLSDFYKDLSFAINSDYLEKSKVIFAELFGEYFFIAKETSENIKYSAVMSAPKPWRL